MLETFETLLSTLLDEKLGSKVAGRRNYAVVTYDNKFYKLGYGTARSRGLLCWYLKEMHDHNIHIYTFTYKKDWEECSKVLSDLNYKIINY